jgi:hypothetical protein
MGSEAFNRIAATGIQVVAQPSDCKGTRHSVSVAALPASSVPRNSARNSKSRSLLRIVFPLTKLQIIQTVIRSLTLSDWLDRNEKNE